ncbi:Gfo/Idh/MocA family protein [Paenibacillus cymbidii]|uniref:Gfo/Idh/MocA family protein n=1 Tax=Paenibacillus cymbidii TaxID=1639034 RepID=UPI0010811207|nr:Gfo/Idh/MocA family oxidoreductase [Paenibacillus cymbidii]
MTSQSATRGSGGAIRLGIIGAGNIGHAHMSAFKQLPGVELALVTDMNRHLAERRKLEHQIGTVADSAEAIIGDPSIDAVVIAVPNLSHAPLAIQALRAGKHVLLEKPMAIDTASAKDIVRVERESGRVLLVGHQMRWEWVAQAIKAQADKQAFGRIYHVKAGWLRRKGIPGWGTWFTQKAQSGGGPLIDIGVHMLDLSLHLMGGPRPVAVYGSVYAELGPQRRGIGTWGTPDWNGRFDVEDMAAALIRMDDGSMLSLEASWAVHLDTDSAPFVHLLGTEGGAAYRGSRGKLLTERFDREVELELATPADDEGSRLRMSRHFLACVRGEEKPVTTAMTGLASNLVLGAIYESSRTGREVELDWTL